MCTNDILSRYVPKKKKQELVSCFQSQKADQESELNVDERRRFRCLRAASVLSRVIKNNYHKQNALFVLLGQEEAFVTGKAEVGMKRFVASGKGDRKYLLSPTRVPAPCKEHEAWKQQEERFICDRLSIYIAFRLLHNNHIIHRSCKAKGSCKERTRDSYNTFVRNASSAPQNSLGSPTPFTTKR